MIKEMRKKLARLRAIHRIQRNKRLKVWIKPLLIVGFITVILSSCLWVFSHMGDPLKNITFLNHTNAHVTVKIEPISPDTHFSRTNRINAHNASFMEAGRGEDNNTIYLPNSLDEQGYLFGMGYWDKAKIERVSQDMGKLTFITTDKTLVYENSEQIERLLQTNWEKSGKENTIEIEVK